MTPRVSILLPVRDAAGTLPDALGSLTRQTATDWECILVDDASRDATAAVARDWAARDRRIVVHRLPEHGGIVAALRCGVSHARGRFLARQDADDISLPTRLETTLARIEPDRSVGAAACGVELFPAPAIGPGLRAYAEWLNGLITPEALAREIWVESPLPHPAVVMRREAYEEVGGYQEPPWPEDYDLWLRMHGAGWKLVQTGEVLYRWRHHQGRLTFRDPRYDPAAFLACKLHHLMPHLRDRSLLIWGAGRDGKRLARALGERGCNPVGFIDIDPRKIGRTRLGLPVRAPGCLEGGPGSPPHRILVAVGTAGARELIRRRLVEMGWTEPEDFLCLH